MSKRTTGYTLYIQECMTTGASTKGKNVTVGRNKFKRCVSGWRKMSAAQKKVYNDRAEKIRANAPSVANKPRKNKRSSTPKRGKKTVSKSHLDRDGNPKRGYLQNGKLRAHFVEGENGRIVLEEGYKLGKDGKRAVKVTTSKSTSKSTSRSTSRSKSTTKKGSTPKRGKKTTQLSHRNKDGTLKRGYKADGNLREGFKKGPKGRPILKKGYQLSKDRKNAVKKTTSTSKSPAKTKSPAKRGRGRPKKTTTNILKCKESKSRNADGSCREGYFPYGNRCLKLNSTRHNQLMNEGIVDLDGDSLE